MQLQANGRLASLSYDLPPVERGKQKKKVQKERKKIKKQLSSFKTKRKKGKGLAIAGFIFSLVSAACYLIMLVVNLLILIIRAIFSSNFVFGLLYLSIPGLVFAILGFFLSLLAFIKVSKSRGKKHRGTRVLATLGLIFGAVLLVLSVIIVILL